MNVYLDNAATTKISEETKNYLVSILDKFGNPSSIHSVGEEAKEIISNVRKNVAKFICGKPDEIIFTSGGSASNTLAINGYCAKNNCTILYSPIAHKSMLKCVQSHKYSYPLKVNDVGLIQLDDLKEWLDARNVKPFVVIDYANSEIGTIQSVKPIIELVHFYNGIVYLDCTGSISAIPINVKKLNVDMIGFSAHKIGGLKGVGVLWKKKNIELEPLICGTQEQGLFGGTENVLGIASLGKAVENYDYSCISSENRNYVRDYILNNIPDCYMVGTFYEPYRLPHNLYMCFKGVEGESLMLLLDSKGIQVSTGSACASGNLQPPPTLVAIGMCEEDLHSCIRMTFSGKETKEQLDYVCKTIGICVELLRSLNE